MSTLPSFDWNGATIPFRDGETLAAALLRAGADRAGRPGGEAGFAYFCGIGMCQSCVVVCDGRLVEACTTPATAGAIVRSRHG